MTNPLHGAAGQNPPPRGAALIEPAPIKAVRLKHPWRNVFATVMVIIVVLFIVDASMREAYDWPAVGKYVFDRRLSEAAGYTLLLTVYSMFIAIVLGVTLAVMRLSPNPVVKSVAWVYLWLFRGTPVYVQLVLWGLVAVIYKSIDIGIPFTEPWVSFDTRDLVSAFWIAVIGLSLNEAAYMAEIVRAGLLSVDKGQDEAATALGMSWTQTMTRVVIPQSMRIIIPPTGNEVISMLKTTSLVSAVPFTLELYARSRDISVEIFNPVPLLIVASIWYLAVTSVLMVGQHFLEKRFARGIGDRRPDKKGGNVGPVTAAAAVIPPTPTSVQAAHEGDER